MIISRKHAINLLKKRKAMLDCVITSGDLMISITRIDKQRTDHFMATEKDKSLFLIYPSSWREASEGKI